LFSFKGAIQLSTFSVIRQSAQAGTKRALLFLKQKKQKDFCSFSCCEIGDWPVRGAPAIAPPGAFQETV
jgi:hypothetical protein